MAIQMDDSDSITVSEQSEPSAECWQNMYKLLNFYSLISDPTGILEKSSPENCLSGGNQLPAASQLLISTLHPKHASPFCFTYQVLPFVPSSPTLFHFSYCYTLLISCLPFLHFHLHPLLCFTNLAVASQFSPELNCRSLCLHCFITTFFITFQLPNFLIFC